MYARQSHKSDQTRDRATENCPILSQRPLQHGTVRLQRPIAAHQQQTAVASLNVSGADGFALPQRLPEPGGVDDRVEGAVVCCAAGGVGKERVVFAAGASLPCSRDRAVLSSQLQLSCCKLCGTESVTYALNPSKAANGRWRRRGRAAAAGRTTDDVSWGASIISP